MVDKVTTPLKWHGGKHYLANRIISLMPPHVHYVEPYAGGLSVLLAKDPEGVSEVVNDLNGSLTIFWRVMASETHFAEFARIVEATPFGEFAWVDAEHPRSEVRHGSDVPYATATATAAAFFIRCRQSLAGRMDSFAPLSRNRTRRGMNEQASAWLSAVEGLPSVHARLKRVVVLNRDALDVIRQQDGPNTLFYLDPPYLKETRAAADVYEHEMTGEQHQRMLDVITDPSLEGKVMLSGYDNPLYAAQLAGWNRVDFDLPNNSAGGKLKRRMIECVWCNFSTTEGTA